MTAPKKPKLSELAAGHLNKEYARARAVTQSAQDLAADVLELSTDFLAQNLTSEQYKVDYKRDADGRIAVAPIPGHGLGEAINDRLRRAAAPRP